jgi:hypothetical protein
LACTFNRRIAKIIRHRPRRDGTNRGGRRFQRTFCFLPKLGPLLLGRLFLSVLHTNPQRNPGAPEAFYGSLAGQEADMDNEQIRPLGRAALGAVDDAAGEAAEQSPAERAICEPATAAHGALADVEETSSHLKQRIEAAKAKGRMDSGDR